jgi:DNA-binding FrmR family transcriptional regulator
MLVTYRDPLGGYQIEGRSLMQLDADEMTAVINRAKRAHGHLGKVIRMMEEGDDCEDVLIQLAAVIKAINRTGYAVVATGLQQCITEGGVDSVDAKRMEKLFLGLA